MELKIEIQSKLTSPVVIQQLGILAHATEIVSLQNQGCNKNIPDALHDTVEGTDASTYYNKLHNNL